ncbi:D-alanine--D-alanine ligase [Rhizobium sp. B230/85]|uniref:D-alanine--D-alanine ligase family protein n=1 Tax=unclassified Rhizobium TaxID=2613769 RepID=UPI001ADCE531|nr:MULTISPECIES: D-alanine--D-alanine ligase family protein [unclassified Rhizobium]MBO9133469.1 D-alanine--D-alanine ligase [Rhizobium sp. B209b/85]QXZ97356.1 D-alanine--D-alanine ligase [Rhizobium sp. B230/85]
MSSKPRIAVLFGGLSSEHEVSLMSAANVVGAMDRTRYEIVPIAVTRSGEWLMIDWDGATMPSAVPATGTGVCLLPGGRGRMMAMPPAGAAYELPPVSVVFPVLHGLFGEDGSVQGHCEVADVAYVGCGILGSVAALDKDIAKRLLADAGLAVAPSVTLRRGEPASFETISTTLGLPVFVKPARQGSSVGVGRARTSDEFTGVLSDAFRHDDKVLVETFVDGREIECAVLEDADGSLVVSLPGEIVPAEKHGFYSYDAKYIDADGAVVKVPADLSDQVAASIREIARRAFLALGCEGMARVDVFLQANGTVTINEVNTIPGFTNISMYPKAFAASGIDNTELIDRLIAHALRRDSARRSAP